MKNLIKIIKLYQQQNRKEDVILKQFSKGQKSLIQYTVEHSLRKLLGLQSEQDIELSKEDLAAYLGISVRSLNRSLKNLTE